TRRTSAAAVTQAAQAAAQRAATKAWWWLPSRRCRHSPQSTVTPSSASTAFFAGDARIAVLPAASGAELGGFLKANVAAGPHLLPDGFAGYRSRQADLGEYLKHTPVVQDRGANAAEFFPIIHTLFSNIKAWLVGTHHGVSAKHLPRYL